MAQLRTWIYIVFTCINGYACKKSTWLLAPSVILRSCFVELELRRFFSMDGPKEGERDLSWLESNRYMESCMFVCLFWNLYCFKHRQFHCLDICSCLPVPMSLRSAYLFANKPFIIKTPHKETSSIRLPLQSSVAQGERNQTSLIL